MQSHADPNAGATVEAVLRDELAQGDAMLGSIGPILHHLLDNGGNSFFSDEILSGVRSMAMDLAGQLLAEIAAATGLAEPPEDQQADHTALFSAIVAHHGLLGHLHALALEWQLTRRLQGRLALDPVLPPMIQALMASPDPAVSAGAMAALAAQARFCQAQRRMQHRLEELPGDLLHVALLSMRALAGTDDQADAAAAKAEAVIRARRENHHSRLDLLSGLVAGLGGEMATALSVTHSGVAMFLTALARISAQDRDLAVLATHESQLARLALAMRASGLKPQALEEHFHALHPDVSLPEGFERLGADRAAAILSSGGGFVS